MTVTDLIQNYKRTEVETASPSQLLLMLYDGAIARLHSAGESMRLGQFEPAHFDLLKVQDILTELVLALDWEADNPLVAQLYSLYEYMHGALVKANVRRDVASIDEVAGLLSSLREGWEEAARATSEEDGSAGVPSNRLDLCG